jgi:putative peptidoglycan lipid II flippase
MTASLFARLSSPHPYHRRIAKGALVIGLLTLLAKIFVAGREIAIAWRFGLSGTADAYALALTATTWLPTMIAGVMAVVLVPRLVGVTRSAERRGGFLAELNGSVVALGVAVAALTWFAAPAASSLLASRTEPRTLELTAWMSAQMAPVALLVIGSAYLSARLQARERYGFSVTEAVPALVIILFLVTPAVFPGAAALTAGTVIGYLLQLIVLAAMVRKSDPPLGAMRFSHRSGEWSSLYGSILLMMAGQLLITASNPIDQAFAAPIGEGAVATLAYANRIVTLFSGFGTIVVGRALLPVLSAAMEDGNPELGRRHAIQWSAMLLGLAMLGSAALWVAAPELVRVLFQRGAFTSAASADVAEVVRAGLLQLPPFFAGIALVQWYAAMGKFRAMLGVTACALLAKLALNLLLTPLFGLVGIMAATAAMYAVTAALLAIGASGPAGRLLFPPRHR